MYRKLRVLIGFAVLCMVHAGQAQNIGNTPYSRYGLGELNHNLGGVRQAGMAGAGLSAGNPLQANTQNPALLYYNSITVFDIGVAGQLKTIRNDEQSQRDGNGSLSNLTLVVPVSKRWSSGLSLRPYSTVNYEIYTISRPLPSNPLATVSERYQGEGGLSEVYFGHGFRITNGLTVGASASYLFGAISKEALSLAQDTSLAGGIEDMVVRSDRTRYSDFLFRAGANYRRRLGGNYFLSAGAVYSFRADVDAERKRSYERRTIYNVVQAENLLPDSLEGAVEVPAALRAGISIDRGTNLTVAADLYTQKWSDFKNIQGESELADSYRAALGAEFTPNANSIDNYFERITYRGGLYYGNTPYVINGEQIKDKGVTLGFTLPIGRSTIYDLYQLNAALGYGSRGTTGNGLIAEDYFQFSVGFTVNSRWFIKRRIE